MQFVNDKKDEVERVDKNMLDEIKTEVSHAKKDYYVGMPILSLKQIEWLIKQAEKVDEQQKEIKILDGLTDEKSNLIEIMEKEIGELKERLERTVEFYNSKIK
jgi:HPt (histidine-containing phosphotransfer) domain-containing protein